MNSYRRSTSTRQLLAFASWRALPRPRPDGLPVLEGAFSTVPPLPPLRLLPLLPPRFPVDLGIVLSSFLWVSIASREHHKFPIEAIVTLSTQESCHL